MKKSFTFAVIVFLVAIVSLVFTGHFTEQSAAEKKVEGQKHTVATVTLAPPEEAAPLGQHDDTPGELVAVAPGEDTQEQSAHDGFDVLSVYDALLMLSFTEQETLQQDRNTLAALRSIYAAFGPSPDVEAMAQLQSLLNEALPAPAASDFYASVQQYFAYKQAEQDVRAATATPSEKGAADPLAGYDQLVALRRSYLGEEAASRMFAEEEAQLPYMVQAMAVARDKSLSAEERSRQLAQLQDNFNDVSSRMDSPLARKVLAAKVERLREAGAGPAEIFRVRTEVLGSAEAQRLAEADAGSASGL